MAFNGFLGALEGGNEAVGTGEGGERCENGGGDGLELLVEGFVGVGFGDGECEAVVTYGCCVGFWEEGQCGEGFACEVDAG